MVVFLPSRIMNYKISELSPTDELITLGQIFSEVGDYASTILDNEHIEFSRKCSEKLEIVVRELLTRQSIQSPKDLYEIPEIKTDERELSAMSVGELYMLYRRWPIRRNSRGIEGREPITFYYEGRIIDELQRREVDNMGDQLKIDYCAVTYNNELDNMSFIFSCPVNASVVKGYPDYVMSFSPDEIAAKIVSYRGYKDIMERENLIECVDLGLNLLERDGFTKSSSRLVAEIAELGRRRIISVPDWVNTKIQNEIKQ